MRSRRSVRSRRNGSAAAGGAAHRTAGWRRSAGIPLSYQPGERFHYSHSTDVLGFLVARIAGMPFRDFLRSVSSARYGMHDTDFWTPAEKRDRAAVVYRLDARIGSARNRCRSPSTARRRLFSSGGGGLVSTADDYLQIRAPAAGRRRTRRRATAEAGDGRADDAQSAHASAAADSVHGPFRSGPARASGSACR